jgi:hypothetical protein
VSTTWALITWLILLPTKMAFEITPLRH